MLVENSNQPLYREIKFAPKLYLWTKRGASRHCKMLGTYNYFRIKASMRYCPFGLYLNSKITSIELKLWLTQYVIQVKIEILYDKKTTRTIITNGFYKTEAWLLTEDVANWIEHKNITHMMNTVDEDEKLKAIITHSGQGREMWFLTEDGLYKIIK